MRLRTRTGSKPMTIANCTNSITIDPALAAIDAGDRRLRLADARGNVALLP